MVEMRGPVYCHLATRFFSILLSLYCGILDSCHRRIEHRVSFLRTFFFQVLHEQWIDDVAGAGDSLYSQTLDTRPLRHMLLNGKIIHHDSVFKW
jgi:hypothetical protein